MLDVAEINEGTDIKIKKSVKDTQMLFHTNNFEDVGNQLAKFNAKIKVSGSSQNGVKGSIKINSNPQLSEIIPENFIQQGSILIETKWILGVV